MIGEIDLLRGRYLVVDFLYLEVFVVRWRFWCAIY